MEPIEDGRLIALDWGTSSLRAYLLGGDGARLDMRESADGVAAIAGSGGDFRACFERICADWLQRAPTLPVIAGGMVGSRQGWSEAAYLECPVDLRALGARLLRIDALAGRPFAIVPGLKQSSPPAHADVIRGEETQLLGMIAGDSDSDGDSVAAVGDAVAGASGDGPGAPACTLCVLPGTHSKWVLLRDGRVQSFATFMTGELYAAISSHTIVGRLLPAGGEHFDLPTFRAALEQGVAHAAELTALLFSIRAQGLLGSLAPEHLASRLSGLLIGAELAGARRRFGEPGARKHGEPGPGEALPGAGWSGEIRLLGSALLCERYRVALACLGWRSRPVASDVAARGLFAIAAQAGLIAVS